MIFLHEVLDDFILEGGIEMADLFKNNPGEFFQVVLDNVPDFFWVNTKVAMDE